MRDWEGKFEAALRSLAESARDQAAPSSGADIRRRADMRRRKRAFVLPSALLTFTLAGGTAFGLTAAFGHSSPHAGTARPSTPASQSIASGHGGPATLAPGAGSGHRNAAPSGSGPAAAGGGGGAPPLQPLCQLTKDYPYMAYVQGLSLQPPSGVLDITRAACTPDPQDPSTGKLVPSGPVRQVPIAPGAAALVTAPIGQGTKPSPISLTQLSFGVQQHPGSLFGISFGNGGQVTRITEVYIGGASRSAPSSGPPSLGTGF
jgi:hypothetical protein